FNWDFSAATGFFFTLGSTNYGLAPLPMDNQNFVAVEEDEKGILSWSSSSDFQQFEVFKSNDAKTWEMIVVIPVAKKEKYFEHVDEKLFPGANYYKVVGTTTDGKSVDFGVRYIPNEHYGNIEWTMFPNPNAGSFQLTWKKGGDSQKLRLIIYNSLGQNVLETQMEEAVNKVNLKHLDAGVYHVEVEVDDLKSMKSLVIVD
ncbi:MAG: T9SS type A sorting domain-containing protein, partial [Cytophagales bacterium]|nr:T9SS type A sorting domain-containing protein [Cytophagales bacterium]